MLKKGKVLFPTHFRNLAYSSLEKVASLKVVGLKEIVFLRVLDRDEVGFVPFGGFDKELARELKEAAHLQFVDWGGSLETMGIAWSEVIEVGNPEAKIIEVAEREGVDLIAVGRHNRVTDAIYPGGVEMETLRDSPVPVLLLPPSEVCDNRRGEPIFGHILGATDFSASAEGALDLVISLEGVAGEVSVVHIIENDEVDSLGEAELRDFERVSREKLDEAAARLGRSGLHVKGHLLSGEVAAELLAFASERNVTLITMGTKGRRGLEELFLGSVSHQVAVDARCPVLLVPMPR